MNRRGFLLGLATAALCATTRLYGLASVPMRRKALLSQTNITLAEWAKWEDPEGDIAKIAEYLRESNEILADAVFKEAPRGPYRFDVKAALKELEAIT